MLFFLNSLVFRGVLDKIWGFLREALAFRVRPFLWSFWKADPGRWLYKPVFFGGCVWGCF